MAVHTRCPICDAPADSPIMPGYRCPACGFAPTFGGQTLAEWLGAESCPAEGCTRARYHEAWRRTRLTPPLDRCPDTRHTRDMNTTSKATATTAQRFDAILDLEKEVRIMHTVRAFRPAGLSTYVAERQDRSSSSAQARLFAAIDALTPDEAAEFGRYRAAFWAEVESAK